jgi:hypothetical protein
MEKEIRQCWAFHKHGSRCEHPAGHPGKHVVSKEWDDLDCATPGEFESQPATLVTEKSVTEPQPVLQEKPLKCVACNHAHRNAECKCGCHEFIG